jgi:hypothetical protein
MQALPLKTLNDEKSIDFVFTNEGVYSLRNLLGVDNLNQNNLSKIKGIAWRDKDGTAIINKAESIVSNAGQSTYATPSGLTRTVTNSGDSRSTSSQNDSTLQGQFEEKKPQSGHTFLT